MLLDMIVGMDGLGLGVVLGGLGLGMVLLFVWLAGLLGSLMSICETVISSGLVLLGVIVVMDDLGLGMVLFVCCGIGGYRFVVVLLL